MPVTGDVMIGAERVEDADRSFRAVNPATGKLLEPAFAFAGAAEVERACALAWAAFPVYRETILEDRARFLEIIAANIMQLGDALVERACAETGLPRGRIEGERARTVGQLKLFADVVRVGEWRIFGSILPFPIANRYRARTSASATCPSVPWLSSVRATSR